MALADDPGAIGTFAERRKTTPFWCGLAGAEPALARWRQAGLVEQDVTLVHAVPCSGAVKYLIFQYMEYSP
jgi:hypothetical protein